MEEEQLTLKNDILFKTFFSRKGNENFLQEFSFDLFLQFIQPQSYPLQPLQ